MIGSSIGRENLNDILYKRGTSFYKIKDYERAILDLERLMKKKLDEKRYEILYILGQSYFRLDNCKKALEVYKEIFEQAENFKKNRVA